jgi:hypothetical protein
MLFSMQDPDYHAYQGVAGAKGMIGDALDWAASTDPVPEPASGLLLLAGLAIGITASGFASRNRR